MHCLRFVVRAALVRPSQGRAGSYRVGACYVKEENDGDAAREEACSDVFFAPLPKVELTGSSLYDLRDDGWARHDYRLALGPFAGRVRLTATFASTDYRHYFQDTTNEAFDQVDAQEQLDRIGGEVGIELGRGFRLTGEYASFSYDVAESAEAYGGRLDWAGATRTAGAGYRQVHGDADEERYQQFRAYGSGFIGPVAVAAGGEISLKWQHGLYWGGLRGAISLALALSLPAQLSSTSNQLRVMTFGVVLFTLIVQGLTMKPLVRRLGVIAPRTVHQDEYERRHARAVASRIGFEHLQHRRKKGMISDHTWKRLSPVLDERLRSLQNAVREVMIDDPSVEAEELDTARREYYRAQRSAISSPVTR